MKMPMTKYRGFYLHCASSGDVLIFRDKFYITLSENLDEACRVCDCLIYFFSKAERSKR